VTANTYNNNLTYVYDYFLKDHLGNTRTVLTDELEQDIYPAATVESASDQIENAYYNINTANIVSNPPTLTSPTNQSYPNNNGIPNPDSSINTSAISSYMYKISPSTNGGTNTGLGITIKVMTGDNITIFGKSFWHNNNPSIQNTGYNQVAATLLTLLAGAPAVASTTQGITPSLLTNSSTISTDLSSWLANEPQPMTKPKAFINWVLFDEQFRPDTSNGSSGVDAVDDTADVLKPQMDNVTITKSGYLYIYCSNESNIDVFFDNLQVVDTRGPLLETGSYYPFGLTMAGISDKAVKSQYAENKYRFNKGTELQNKEFSDGTGLELYETNFRSLDPQLGRFWQMDPLAQTLPSFSPYQFADDNPIFFNDPLGLLSDSAHPQDLKPVTVTAHRKTDNTSAWGLGWEWLTGTGAREHHFKDGDPFTKMLQKHEHIQDTRDKIVNGLANHTIKLKNPYTNNYALGGLSGVPKYLRDYSTLMTGGLTGNIAVTFLGSYGLKYEVLSIDEQSGTAQVHFHMDNASTIESATHPPVIGYTQWWSNNIGKPLNDFFSSGAMSKTVQTADWTETIQWKGDK
jgi:RHS repeat-associated protein